MTQATLSPTPNSAESEASSLDYPQSPLPGPSMRPLPVQPLLRPTGRHLWLLLAITLLGGLLRFSFPTRPLLWGDDAYTVYRTHAEYQAMLDILQNDGFTPLHYELYWLLGRAAGTVDSPMTPGGPNIVHSVGLTPTVLRLLPALWGTLMVPAMYLLAVHLVRRRTALVVALVTACSAYLLGYSRDMKMYMLVWCFSALSAGCLLWWFRTGSRIAWLAWVASSLAMASSHMTGMALLPFEAIFFLTRSRVDWKQSILFVIGLAIIILPPAGYITQFNRWAQEEVEDFGFEVEGLGWIGPYNSGRSGMDLVRYASSAYLMSWEWPKPVHVSARSGDPSTERGVAPWILAGLKTATVMFLLLAAVGMMPWSARLRGVKEGEATPPQPWWRVALWLGLWMVIPIYFMYCRSVPDFDGPRDWWTNISKSVAGTGWADEHGAVRGLFWWTLGVAAVVLGALVFVIPGFRRAIVRLVPLWALVALLAAVLRAGLPGSVPAGTNWIIVVTRPLEVWWDWMSDWPVVIALLIVLPGLALFYCARNWPQRLARVGQLALVVAALLGSCYAVYAAVDAKFKKEVAQALEPRAGDVKASVVIARHTPGEVEGATERVAQRAWQSIFMPRYVGFVWIAFCIALCALLMRLPTRGLRIAAVVIVVGVNMAQFSGRLFAGTEPPLDELARDIWAHDSHNADRDKTARVYVNESPPPGAGHPGYGWLNGQQGKYYLGLARGYWIHPTEWKNASSSRYFDVSGGGGRRGGGGGMSYSSIAADVRSMPQAVKRVIVWEQYISQKPPAQDPLLPLLGNQWQKATDDRDYDVRFHWTWADLNTYRRSEYVRK